MNVRLVTNPSTDGSFRRRAENLLADRAKTAAELEQSLKGDYPAVAVVTGITERDSERWYAYREGRWVNSGASDGEEQPLSRRPSASR